MFVQHHSASCRDELLSSPWQPQLSIYLPVADIYKVETEEATAPGELSHSRHVSNIN